MEELGNSLQENNDQEKWQKENLEMKDDFGQLDTTESKWPLIFPPGGKEYCR